MAKDDSVLIQVRSRIWINTVLLVRTTFLKLAKKLNDSENVANGVAYLMLLVIKLGYLRQLILEIIWNNVIIIIIIKLYLYNIKSRTAHRCIQTVR